MTSSDGMPERRKALLSGAKRVNHVALLLKVAPKPAFAIAAFRKEKDVSPLIRSFNTTVPVGPGLPVVGGL
jgi:hypothetical protein